MASNEDVTLEEALNVFYRSKQLELFTMIPGKIIEFDVTTQLAKVEITIKRVFATDEEVILPQIENVPCVVHRTEKMAITTPIKPEDNCLLMFSQRALDTWIFNGNGFIPPHGRLHDKTDCFAMVGIYPQSLKINNYHPDNMTIRNLINNNRIEVYPENQIDLIANETSTIMNSSGGITNITPGVFNTLAQRKISMVSDDDSIDIIANGNLVAEGAEPAKDIKIQAGDGKITILSGNGKEIIIDTLDNGDITIRSGGLITLDGETKITGNLTVQGDVTAEKNVNVTTNVTATAVSTSGDVTAGTISLMLHVHPGSFQPPVP